eukprot:258983_1
MMGTFWFFSLIIIATRLFLHCNSQSCSATQIIFSNDGNLLFIAFSDEVDTSGLLDNPSTCNPYFNDDSMLSLSDSECYFSSVVESTPNSDTSTLLIDLSSNATIQPYTESLTLLPNAFSCSNISITLVVEPPLIPIDTQIQIDGTVPNTIGSCSDFTISAYTSSGITYRVYDWIWTIRNGRKQDKYYTGQTPQLVLTPVDIPYAGEITITVQVTTYLLTSSIVVFEVHKSDLPSPDINVLGPTQWIYSEALTYSVQISHTACAFDDTLYTFDLECTVDDATVHSAMQQHSNQFYIPSGLMLIGNTYTFTCEARSDDGILIAPASDALAVQIVSGSIIASIAGGNAMQLTTNALVLDAESLSYSWSNMDGSIEDTTIQWECTSLNRTRRRRRELLQVSTTSFFSTAAKDCGCPSVVTTEPLLRMAANTLMEGCLYQFTVDIDNGGNTASDSVVIEAISSGASVSIWRDSYCINEDHEIQLIASATTDDAGVSIQQYFWKETTGYLDTSKWERLQSTLIIPKNTLAPQRPYTFSVEVTTSNSISSTAYIEITVNDAPVITVFDVDTESNNDDTIEQTYTLSVTALSDYEPNSFQFFWRYNDDSLDESDNVPLTARITSSIIRHIYLPEGDLIITAQVRDLCDGVSSITKYVSVQHDLEDITCHAFHEDIVHPLFETAAAVKDFNRVLNVFDIATTTIRHLQLQANEAKEGNSQNTSNVTMNATALYFACFSRIIDSFSTALEVVTSDLDSCVEDTTILQKQLLTAIRLMDDDANNELSAASSQIFEGIVDKVWSSCETIQTGTEKLPFCKDVAMNPMDYNNSKCVNESTMFSGILTPAQVFKGEQVTPQQISITTALMDSVLAKSTLTCADMKATVQNIFGLMESIVATDFPGDDGTTLSSASSFYEAFVIRVAPQTEVTVTFEDEDYITIGEDVTVGGREVFSSYGSGELDSVDIFVIRLKHEVVSQCVGSWIPDALQTNREFTVDPDAANSYSCGQLLSDIYLIEIDMDSDKTVLTGNVTYGLHQTNADNTCSNEIQNITDHVLALTTDVDTSVYTLCSHFPSALPLNATDIEWDVNGCTFVEKSEDDALICRCNHLSYHAVSNIRFIEQFEIPSLLENKYIFYVVILGFVIIAAGAFIQIMLILCNGYCKLEASVIIYYILFVGCVVQGVCVYLLSTQDSANGNNAEYNEFLSLDVVTSSVRFVILAIILNTWFRIKEGKKASRSIKERWPLNILAVAMICYDVFCVIIQLTNVDNGSYDDVFVIGNLIVNLAAGSLALLWLLWRPVVCIRRRKKKNKSVKGAQGYIRILCIILTIICCGQTLQALFVLFATTEYFDVNSANTPYVSQWRLINYSIDIVTWMIILLFYVCIYVHSTKKMRNNPSQIGAIFKGSSFPDYAKKHKKRREPSYVDDSHSESNRVQHIGGRDLDDAHSPKKRMFRLKPRRKKYDKERAGSESGKMPMQMGAPPPAENGNNPHPPYAPWAAGTNEPL